MKLSRITGFVAALATLTVFASCGKEKSTASLEETKYFQEETSVTFPSNDLRYVSATFLGNGEVRMIKEEAPLTPSGVSLKRIAYQKVVEVYHFTVSGSVYTLTDFEGSASFDAQTGVFTITKDDTTITISNVTIFPAKDVAEDILGKLCRKWTVSRIDINVKGGDNVAVGRIFNNGDLYAIGKYLEDNGINIDSDELEGYSIENVILTKTGEFIVDFASQPSYYGSWDLKSSTFSYYFKDNSNDILTAEASGSVKFSDGKCFIKVSGEIEGSENYTSTLEITLAPAK